MKRPDIMLRIRDILGVPDASNPIQFTKPELLKILAAVEKRKARTERSRQATAEGSFVSALPQSERLISHHAPRGGDSRRQG